MTRLALTVHRKRRGAVEVRAFLHLPTHRHRVGTWCLPESAWCALRDMFLSSRVPRLAVTIDDAGASQQAA